MDIGYSGKLYNFLIKYKPINEKIFVLCNNVSGAQIHADIMKMKSKNKYAVYGERNNCCFLFVVL